MISLSRGYGGVAADGQFVSFDDLVELIQTYEGFHFSIQIFETFLLNPNTRNFVFALVFSKPHMLGNS